MSDDATYIIVERGVAQFAYGRWGAQELASDLLGGPEAMLAFIRGLHQTQAPVIESYLEGYVYIDLDRRELLYWRSQGFAALGLRTHMALVRARWPEWTCAWPIAPARVLAERLPSHATELLELAAKHPPRSLDEFIDANANFPDLLARDDPETRTLIAELGLPHAQAVLESDDVNVWLSLRRDDGGWDHQIFHDLRWCGELGAGVCLGPAILPILRRRPQGGPEFVWLDEDELEAGYLIDPQAKTLEYWSTSSRMSDDHSLDFPRAWPDWTIRPLTDEHGDISGAFLDHCQRVGVAPERLREPSSIEDLLEHLEIWLGPRSSGAEILASAVRRIEREHGSEVSIEVTPPTPGDAGPSGGEDWREQVAAHFAALLASPSWLVLPEPR